MTGGADSGVDGEEEMEEDGKEEKEQKKKEKTVLMWGYLPGVSPQRSPLLHPVSVRMPDSAAGDGWKDVSGGGCGFAMAISDSGKLFTWGSTDDMGQSYLTSGKHEETPEAFPLPTEVVLTKAAAGWAHCVAVTAYGEVYTWGWKECVPTGKVIVEDHCTHRISEEEERHNGLLSDQVSPKSQLSRTSSGTTSGFETKSSEENTKRRRLSSAKAGLETSTSSEESLSALPCLVTLNTGIRISAVAAGGRHTLVLTDVGQVWGWGYGGEGQLGLGSRIRNVSSPHPVPCIESVVHGKDHSLSTIKVKQNSSGQHYKVTGSCIKAIACGGRHSAVVTDAGAVLTFGWGLYGQCGQGCTDDELSPTCVSSLLGIKIQGIAAGLWHTVCISVDGDVYTFGGNQFGQLGTGSDQAETLPRLLEASSLENKNAKMVSCGARHSAIMTEGGEVFCWGWNKYGQLGLGDVVDRNVPTLVPIENYRLRNVSCGWWHTLAISDSST